MKPIVVIINNRDLLTSVIAQIEFFLRCPNVKIVLCDNASTYPPLVIWYAVQYGFDVLSSRSDVHFEPGRQVDTFFFPENRGPRGFSSVFDRIRARYDMDYYFLSEPDIDYSDVNPERLFPDLIAGFETYPSVQGMGISLRIDDLPNIPLRETVLFHEGPNWRVLARAETPFILTGHTDMRFYKGGTDTAGVLRRTVPSWNGGYDGLRSTIHIARHLPWYHVSKDEQFKILYSRPEDPNDKNMVRRPDDFQYYLDHANPSGTVYTSKVLDKGDNRLR